MAHVLLVSYEFPPRGGPGIQRPLQTAKLLSKIGWDVTVLTVEDPPTALVDVDALAEVPQSVRVLRAWSREPTRVIQHLRRVTGGKPRGGSGGASLTGAPSGVIRAVRAFFLPDEKVGWVSYAVDRASTAHRESPFDVILATGPPFSAMKVAWELASRLGIPWVADLRDPIVDNYFFRAPTAMHRRYMRRFEGRVVKSAARVIAATGPIADAVRLRHPEASDRVVTIPNGYDPSQFASSEPDTGVFTLTHVGSFQGDVQPHPLLRALSRARDLAPDTRIRLRLVGPDTGALREAVVASRVAEDVEITGFVPHSEALRAMKEATVLALALGDTPEMKVVLTGKLPEYIGTRKPIFALVPQGAARDVLERYGAAAISHPSETEGAAAALLELHDLWRRGSLPVPDASVVEEFRRDRLVALVAQQLEETIRPGLAEAMMDA